MNNSTLCIDVSKSNSVATGFLSYNKPYAKTFSFSHTPDEMEKTLLFLDELQKQSNCKPDIVLEATGNYYKAITNYFYDHDYSVYVLNPLQTSSEKRKSIRKVKTDPVDTYRISQVYYTKNLNPHVERCCNVEELRSLCRQWDAFNELHTETQLKFRSLLILVFPKYDTVFDHVCSKTSLKLVSAYPSPKDIISASREELFNIIKLSKHSDSWCEEKLQKLYAAARESLSYDVAQQSNTRVLQSYVKTLLTQKDIQTEIRALISEQTKQSLDYKLLLSIPGVGEVTAATILGEIGDIVNFESPKQLIAYAGLDPSVYQSGSFRAKNTKISKRGSHYLRKALFQAASAAVRKRPNGPCNSVIYEYYTNKLEAGKPYKVALVATCSKLLRIIHGILSSKTAFNADKV
jgi:transposase